jgi:hypothetical protein
MLSRMRKRKVPNDIPEGNLVRSDSRSLSVRSVKGVMVGTVTHIFVVSNESRHPGAVAS